MRGSRMDNPSGAWTRTKAQLIAQTLQNPVSSVISIRDGADSPQRGHAGSATEGHRGPAFDGRLPATLADI